MEEIHIKFGGEFAILCKKKNFNWSIWYILRKVSRALSSRWVGIYCRNWSTMGSASKSSHVHAPHSIGQSIEDMARGLQSSPIEGTSRSSSQSSFLDNISHVQNRPQSVSPLRANHISFPCKQRWIYETWRTPKPPFSLGQDTES